MMEPTESESLKKSPKDYGTSSASSGSTGGGDVPPQEAPPPTTQAYMFTFIIALSGMNLGYDIGITGGLSMMMSQEMQWSITQTELFIGCINILAIFGALFTALISDISGRRGIFLISSFCFISGAGLLTFANSWPMAMVGRVWMGLGVGLALTVDSMYINEIAPPAHRGFLATINEIAINVGIVAGAVVNYFLSTGSATWHVAAASCAICPILLLILALCVLPESPRWLVMKGRIEDAEKVLKLTMGEGSDVEATVQDIREHIEEELKFSKQGWGVIFNPPTPGLRAMLLAGFGLAVGQQITGIDTFIYYSPFIFKRAGISDLHQRFGLTITLGLVKLTFIFLNTFTIDKWGRRPLVLWSSALIFFSLCGISACSALDYAYGELWFLFGYMAAFSIGMGPVTRLIPELFPNRIRAKAMSLATSLNRVSAAVMATIPMTMSNLVGMSSFFAILAGLALGTWIYLYFLFPESKGLTLEELEDEANMRYEASLTHEKDDKA